MAIFDSETRPRGLRAPSLTAMKSGSYASKSLFTISTKKSTESLSRVDAPIPPTKPTPPSRKELPPPPRPVSMNPSPSSTNVRRGPGPGARSPLPPPPPSNEQTAVTPRPAGRRADPPAALPQQQAPPPPTLAPAAAAAGTREPVTPLEDFIPTPESEERGATPFTPRDIEFTAAPLNTVHYACFQEHRTMPEAKNVWYPLPCMTCKKHDTEIRHRCVFCCLRICRDCFQSLQKCQNRSLGELMARVR